MTKTKVSPMKRPPAPLKEFAGAKPPAPAWFAKALETPVDTGMSVVEDATIHWKAWGERGQPGLVLVHGGVAHKDWWDSIAPFLAPTRRVVALDLSGMGDSDHREKYRMDLYAKEVMTVAREGGAFDAGAPYVVGHSFGGFVSLATAMEYGEALRGVAILDSPIRPPEEQRRSSPPSRGGNTYATFEAALERFRLLPEQPCENAFLLDHIARQSLKQATRPDGTTGWTWKFDPHLWEKLEYDRKPPAELAASLKTRVALFRGGDSILVNDEIWAFMRETFGPETSMISIPNAQHHLILDQPIAVASALEVLTGPGWG
ncbi:MAG: alpha/beta hydrolase [Maricaulis sp.]|jgi:pimeloyl-ACP methyl ester carboxylesterase|uniref:alpha/beta fold hydrolase n=1 Tax=Maricaulis sp. TaxID=1486257 RepID=UPI0025C6339D|nr:alpha/beta hydrolase [Maricaulis sp.]MDM7984689.1 alpha/beta hydrolase [Maricaulis sp.]